MDLFPTFHEFRYNDSGEYGDAADFAMLGAGVFRGILGLMRPHFSEETEKFYSLEPWRVRVELWPFNSCAAAAYFVLDVGDGEIPDTLVMAKIITAPPSAPAMVVEPLEVYFVDTIFRTTQPLVTKFEGLMRINIAGQKFVNFAPTAHRYLAAIATATAEALSSLPTHAPIVDENKLKKF